MGNSTATKVAVLAVVIVAAAVIIYPKVFGSPAAQDQDTMAASSSLTPGERALETGLKSGKPTMILFHSNSCVPCKEMSEIVAQVEPELKGRANFVDIVVDDQSEARLIAKYGVNTIPTSVFFDKQGAYIGINVGVIEKEKLIEFLTNLEK